MNVGRLSLSLLPVIAALVVGCGKDDSPAGPGGGSGNPVPTSPGSPDGTPTTASIGPAGGSLASSDGLLTLTIPAGALSSATDITVQPLTSTAWGGVGKGYRLTPHGLHFAAPIDLAFTVTDAELAVTAADFLEIAVQDDQGVWGILKARSLDLAEHELTGKTTHFSDYSMVSGVQIVPWAASVQTGQSLGLNVTFCAQEVYHGSDEDLVSLLITCDLDLAPVGTFTNWSVNGVAGGNATVGTVAPTSGPAGMYTAPASLPSSNPVAVSVHTTYQGMNATLVSNVTVTSGERWVGTASAVLPSGTVVVQSLTWEFVSTDGYTKVFHPTGTVVQTELIIPGCNVISYMPGEHAIAPDDGGLSIDYTTDPPNYSGGGATYWGTYLCMQCPPEPRVQCIDGATAGGAWFSGTGDVTDDGTTIAGTTTNVFGTFTFSFTRQP